MFNLSICIRVRFVSGITTSIANVIILDSIIVSRSRAPCP